MFAALSRELQLAHEGREGLLIRSFQTSETPLHKCVLTGTLGNTSRMYRELAGWRHAGLVAWGARTAAHRWPLFHPTGSFVSRDKRSTSAQQADTAHEAMVRACGW